MEPMNEVHKWAAKKLRVSSDCPGLKCLNLSGQDPAFTAVKRTANESFYFEVYKKYFKKAG